MKFRQITPFMVLMFFIALMLQAGCDTLVTENNTTILTDTTLAIGCVKCHDDTDNPLLRPEGQFQNSAHANFANLDILFDEDGNRCGDACHTHEGYLEEVSSVSASTNGKSTINCYTCHTPHTGNYGTWKSETLRGLVPYVTLDNDTSAVNFGLSNSCIHCHKATNIVTGDPNVVLSKDFGPHESPQANILGGQFGYFVDYSNPQDTAHKDNGCINCHYGSTQVNQGQGFIYAEHTFRLQGLDSTQQYNKTCGNEDNACHGNTNILDNGFYNRPSIAAIDTLSLEVISFLESFRITDSTGLTYTVGDSFPRTYAEAYYNFLLYKNDRSRGIHNPEFVNKLLSKTKTVLDSLPPLIAFEALDSLVCLTDPTITFIPSIIGGFDELVWRFGDDAPIITTEDTSITIVNADSGIYNVTLDVTSFWDSAGVTASTVGSLLKENFITIDAPPTADFTFDLDTVCVGEPVTFTSTSQFLSPESMVDEIWYFGDGDSAFLAEASHSYTTSGTYFVSLEVTSDCGFDDTLMVDSIVVLPSPTVVINFIQDATDSLKYTFTDDSPTSTIRIWEFISGTGIQTTIIDNGLDTTITTSVTFPVPAFQRRAKLTIIDINGCQNVMTELVFSP